jgi:hypothetical protein
MTLTHIFWAIVISAGVVAYLLDHWFRRLERGQIVIRNILAKQAGIDRDEF